MWQLASKEIQGACKRWRLKLNRNYEWIRVREVKQGQTVRTFALTGLRWSSVEDIRRARDLCLAAERSGCWPEPGNAGKGSGWQALVDEVIGDLVIRIPKRGSHQKYVCILRGEIARLEGPITAETLEAWINRYDPLADYYRYLTRLETISAINRALPDLELEALLLKLRARRRQRVTGSAAQLVKATARRVRVIPTTEAVEDWLLSMRDLYDGFPFNQYLFALIATYGLRPHEVWHVKGIDEAGWIVVPGGPIPDEKGRALATKTSEHVSPPSPAAWVELFNLKEGFARFQELLHERYPVAWRPVLRDLKCLANAQVLKDSSPVMIPVNNTELGQYVAKLLSRGMAPKLLCEPLGGGKPKEILPYDLRHAYAVRLLDDPAYALVPLEEHASWMGHDAAVHTRYYHRWIGSARLLAAKQAVVEQSAPVLPSRAAKDQSRELEALRLQLEQARSELAQREQVMGQIRAMMGGSVAV